jgi:hypothetical protein
VLQAQYRVYTNVVRNHTPDSKAVEAARGRCCEEWPEGLRAIALLTCGAVEALERDIVGCGQCALWQTVSSFYVDEVERAMSTVENSFDGRWWMLLNVLDAHAEMCKVLSALHWGAVETERREAVQERDTVSTELWRRGRGGTVVSRGPLVLWWKQCAERCGLW